ncbi:hypothetical protein P4H65_01910 [Paenibacillus chitinolyticus]|uniref:hypothetical protein n=1 Tax=Paenibacillus chitinolyticus TaxID=79263 RepID=UPI002DBFAA48|nr:hypothetical protein [Paenibacillus chitinolyticus]MEC0244571.1 hypothetical protein [Paenibacillus chitinolyticus]
MIVLAVPCFQFYNSKQKTQEKIDGDFVMSIARISAGLNSVNSENQSGYVLAIENGSKAAALSTYTTFNKADSNVSGITSELLVSFENLFNSKKALKEKEKVIDLIQ